MLTPEQIDELPDEVESLFSEMELLIIRILARKVSEACSINATGEWLLRRAEMIGLASEEVYQVIAETLGMSDKVVAEMFYDTAYKSALEDATKFELAGVKSAKKRVAENSFLNPIVEAVVRQTNGKMHNIGRSTGLMFNNELLEYSEYFTKALDTAQMAVMTGVQTYDEAVKTTLEKASAKGIQYVDYESGYVQNVTSASRTITRTGINQMATQMNEKICEELDLDLVEVTAHGGARPSHAEWQGKVYSRSGSSEKYKNLAEVTGLGTVTGLCGANCRHSYYGYVEGMPRAYTDEQLKNIDPPPFEYNGKKYTIYEATQRMRYMERQMRKTQRKMEAFKEAGLEAEYQAMQAKLRRQRAEYKKFAKAGNIRPRLDKAKYVKGT